MEGGRKGEGRREGGEEGGRKVGRKEKSTDLLSKGILVLLSVNMEYLYVTAYKKW